MSGGGEAGLQGGVCPPSPRTPSLLLIQELVQPVVQQHQLSLPIGAFPHQD